MRRIESVLLLMSCVGAGRIVPFARAEINDCTCNLGSTGSNGQPSKIHSRMFIGNKPVPLWIAAGPRHTDRILALMLRQILKNTFGFREVQLFNASSNYDEWLNAMACNATITNCSDRPMLHVGLIQTDNQTSTFGGLVSSVGELGPRLRRGWFVPSRAVVEEAEFGLGPDHWRYFTKQHLAERFEFDETKLNEYTLMDEKSGDRWCNNFRKFKDCDATGQYVPELCKNQRCATVLAAFPHENYNDLLTQINKLRLFVKVAWVGKRLDHIVSYRNSSYSRIVFFDHSVSPLTYNRTEMTEVLFPSCDTGENPNGCIYHSSRMQKLAWQNVRQGARKAYRLMEKITLTAKDYSNLMHLYRQSLSDDDDELLNVACEMCQKYWVDAPKWGDDVKVYPEILIQTVVEDRGRSIENVTQFAMTRINKMDLFSGYILNQTVIYGNCNGDTVIAEYMESVTTSDETIVAVVGSECNHSLDNIVGLANYYTHAVATYRADGATGNDQSGHDNFFRAAPDVSIVPGGYIAFMKSERLREFVHLFDNEAASSSWNTNLRSKADNHSMKMAAYVDLSTRIEGIRSDLEAVIGTGRRILVGDFQIPVGLRTMCLAYELKMTWRQKYLWLLPPWLPRGWFRVSQGALPENCTVEKLEEALKYTFTYQFKEVEDDSFEIDTGYDNVYDFNKNYHYSMSPDLPYAAYAHDAVWTLARSLSKLQKNNEATISLLHNPDEKKKIMAKLIESIRNDSFNGLSGTIRFVNNTRKASQIYLYQYVNGEYNCVDSFYHYNDDSGAHTGLISLVTDWRSLPDHITRCRFAKEKQWPYGPITDGSCPLLFETMDSLLHVGCNEAMAIFIVVVTLTSVIILTIIVSRAVRRHYERKMREIEQQQVSPLSSLAEYELPEDSIRIYRFLGEGAFGKVYLGEYLKEKDCVIPVAVKTAKDPKNINAKMELLSEAEVMKRFEHVNILRLIGVITQHDKCQIVTDFMMFGNLRSYLQDRRHLAVKGEIDAAHLTRMALDISRGLSYLASLNYVHGDLACRNCLVHETLTIKIADFGFCKNLVDSDYYRLVRSGPMPVRWMSPELLSTGVYHVQSDIWSFGVVLYEIVTFGAYPYSDLDDHKVQDFIRSGGFPTLPQKISSKLEALFLQMWTLKKEDRPTALELFEILTADAELVHPSLEEGPSRVDYISLGAQGRHSKGSISAGATWANIRRVRSPPGSAHNSVPRIRYNAVAGTARLDID